MDSITIREDHIKAKLTILIHKECDFTIATSTALDVHGYGNTEEEALDSLDVSLDIFFEETMRKGTLRKLLNDQGWVGVNPYSHTIEQNKSPVLVGIFCQREHVSTYA